MSPENPFLDAVARASFARDGYAVVPLLDAGEVAGLQTAWERLHPSSAAGFHATLFSRDVDYKRGADRAIRAIATPRLAAHLAGFRPLLGNFVAKLPGAEGAMTLHQDWTFVDERRFFSLNCWCPLIDVDAGNGALHVWPGSHRLLETWRGTRLPPPTAGLEVPIERLRCLRMRAGEACIYDHRLLHASPPNRRESARVAFALTLVPEAARPIHAYRSPLDGAVELYAIDESFFESFTYGDRELPPGLELLERLPDPALPRFTLERLEAGGRPAGGWLARWRSRRRGGAG